MKTIKINLLKWVDKIFILLFIPIVFFSCNWNNNEQELKKDKIIPKFEELSKIDKCTGYKNIKLDENIVKYSDFISPIDKSKNSNLDDNNFQDFVHYYKYNFIKAKQLYIGSAKIESITLSTFEDTIFEIDIECEKEDNLLSDLKIKYGNPSDKFYLYKGLKRALEKEGKPLGDFIDWDGKNITLTYRANLSNKAINVQLTYGTRKLYAIVGFGLVYASKYQINKIIRNKEQKVNNDKNERLKKSLKNL